MSDFNWTIHTSYKSASQSSADLTSIITKSNNLNLSSRITIQIPADNTSCNFALHSRTISTQYNGYKTQSCNPTSIPFSYYILDSDYIP